MLATRLALSEQQMREELKQRMREHSSSDGAQ
jgi:hypothetical protein